MAAPVQHAYEAVPHDSQASSTSHSVGPYVMEDGKLSCQAQSEEGASTTKQSSRLRMFGGWWWWLELSSMLLSIVCIMLVVVILIVYDGKPLTEWGYAVPPNTALSILTTVGRSTLLLAVSACISQLKWLYFDRPRQLHHLQQFEDASRGPFGSLTFLLTVKGRAIWATLASIITILTLAYGPMTQQALVFPARYEYVQHEQATVGGAVNWQSRDLEQKNMALNAQISILAGLMGRSADTTFTCPATYCRFPDFTSLGMCDHCEPLTVVKSDCASTPINGTTYHYCTYTPDNSAGTHWPDAKFWFNGTGKVDIRYEFDDQHALSLRIARQTVPPTPADDVYTPGSVEMHGCSLQFCARAYMGITSTLTVSNANSTETPLTVTDRNETHIFLREIEPPTNSTLRRRASSPSTVYHVSRTTSVQLANLLQNILSSESPELSYVYQYFEVTDIPLAIKNVALAFTDQIRSASNLQANWTRGEAWLPQTYIHARWAWLVAPLALTAAGVVLLVYTMVVNRKTGLLKGSSLALLAHGFEEDGQAGEKRGESERKEGWRREEDAKELERWAQQRVVVYGEGKDGGRRFVRVG